MPDSTTLLLIAADATLALHLAFVGFVVCALIVVLLGGIFRWDWVRNPWFRGAHLVAIGIVVVQSWFGVVCPLTKVEMWLRTKAGDAVYSGTFISHWMESILYYRAPPWVFAICYTAFGALVIAGWYWVRPRPFRPAGNC